MIKDFYSEKYAHCQADMICSRYVFEHIDSPADFLRMIRRAIGDSSSVVYFEVPNVELILEKLSVWDVIYEHFGYFSHCSLEYIFRRCGFKVLDVYSAYDDQFLAIEAIPAEQQDDTQIDVDPGRFIELVESFQARLEEQIASWQNAIDVVAGQGKKAVLWGAGAKGVSMLNMLSVEQTIHYIVDVNPRKVNKYVAGTGQRIIEPIDLLEYRPDHVFLSNPVYKNEVSQLLVEMGVDADISG